jgi:FtsP/CotA-like multicopper oxidase with cupredoxin domain
MAKRTFRRRAVIAGGIGGGLAVVCGGALGASLVMSYQDLHRDTVGDLSFENPLSIPPLLEGAKASDGSYAWGLDLQTGITEILPGKTTPTWGANGAFLAPTLRASRGQTVTANVRNSLPEATTIHWHGMHLPAAMDGGPHQMVQPGESWSPTWEIDQPASTLWYHPHPHGETFRHVYRGIAGMIILDDDASRSSGLPSTYGVDDIPLILQDKLFKGDGEFKESVSGVNGLIGATSTGLTGDTMLINGTYNPHFDVTTGLVRLRVLNGSNARSYALEFSDRRAFHLVAAENGILPEPLQLDRLQISPGERAEIVVAFTPGEVVVLRSIEPDLGASFINSRWWGGDDRLDLLEFRAAETPIPSGDLPPSIAVDAATVAIPQPADVRVRSLTFRDHNNINKHEFDMSRIDQVVAAGATEIWEIDGAGTMHTFHIHGASFRVLDIGGDAPPGYATGLKDTVYIPPDKKVRVLVRFRDYIDPMTPYMYHCHLLRHEDRGMMGQFVVVEPGTEDSTPTELPHMSGDMGHH